MTSAAPDRRAIIAEALHKIDDLTARLAIAEKADTEPIAVIGMGCRFPGGADNPDQYWELLTEGRSGVIRVPENRWDADAYYHTDHTVPGTICNREGGFLTSWQPDQFDAEFFGISPREAAGMDPQQRLLMEVSWEALEDAGLTPKHVRGTATAVYVGMTTNDYSLTFAGRLAPEDVDPYIPFGNAANFAAGRLSYFLGVNGPAVVIDTACSSSLVAIHLACQSLRRREADNALAAGVNLMLSPENTIACSRWGMLAPDGSCKAFDADANGYVRSEGCGVVVLKRLEDAERDGDRVLAVIRGSGVNQDGASSGQTVPNGPAQQALLRRVLAAARLQPGDIDYIEAHGTGTPLGDPIELDALAAVFGDRGQRSPLVLGSVKTNLGHLESAAGVAGFIKTVLALKQAHIPRQLHFKRLNPHAAERATRFTIAADPMDWPATGEPRRAGVSSFGVSGTNAHIVVEQAPDPVAAESIDEPAVSTLVISGKSEARLAGWAATLADWLAGPGAATPLADVAHTLDHHRAQYPLFATVTAVAHRQAVAGLRAIADGYRAPGVVEVHEGDCRPGTVFIYSGQGSQWAGMGRQLLAAEPAFAAAVDELEPDFVEQVGFSLRDVLSAGDLPTGIERIQPVLVGVQLALTALWGAHGVKPDAVIGHSMGEVSAAVVAGALTPADGLKVIATRSRLLAGLSGQGAMALVELDVDAAGRLIKDYPGVSVAVHASPRQTVIAGPPDQVDALITVVAARDLLARRVEVDVASHHETVEPVLAELRSALSGLTPRPPVIPLLSTALENVAPGDAVLDAGYWCANLRNPVRFSDVVTAAGADHGTFIEISPHPVLTHALDDILAGAHHHSLGTLARDTDDVLTFHTNLAATHTGAAPTSARRTGPHIRLPHRPWHHTRHWVCVPERPGKSLRDGSAADPAASPSGAPDDWFLELGWPNRELGASGPGDASWLVLAGTQSGPALGALLGARRVIDVTEFDGTVSAADIAGVDHVLYAPPVPADPFDVAEAHRTFHTAKRLATALAAAPSGPKLVMLTRNAQAVTARDRANPAHAILWGLGRTLAVENPGIWGRIVDVDVAAPAELVAWQVASEVAAADGDDQVVYAAGRRHVPRLRRSTPPTAVTGLRSGTSHLVIGSTGNVGPDLIRQLGEMGASTVVAVARHTSPVLDELRATLAQGGSSLVTVIADAADEAAMTALFERFGVDLPALDGVYLAALSGGAGQLTELSDADVAAMFRPKVDALGVLHRLTLTTPVRHFVLFSSVTGLFGSRWLGHYTAAGAFADAFAQARHAVGLPATVVDWGLWKSWADAQPATAAAGLTPMPNAVAIGALPALLSPDAGVHPIVAAADWDQLAHSYRARTAFHIVDDLLIGDDDGALIPDDLGEPAPGTLLGPRVSAQGTVWRARLSAAERPYPGEHRVRGVDVVPASVLLHTLAAVGDQLGATGAADIRFDYPVVLDQPKVVHVSADGDSVCVFTSPSPDTPTSRWVRHVSARLVHECTEIADLPVDSVEIAAFDAESAAELQAAWGIEGRPYPWSVVGHRPVPGGTDVDVELPTATAGVALIDAVVHLARLADRAHDGLMFPAAVTGMRVDTAVTGGGATVRIRRRGGNAAGFTVDIVAASCDGTTWLDVRGLRYAAAETGSAPVTPDAPRWGLLSSDETTAELESRLQAILARELGMPPAAVRVDQPFPELGLDSMMAMAVLRDTKALVGLDVSATMLWDHPTIATLSALLTDMLAPQRESQQVTEDIGTVDDASMSVLDELFAHVESVSAGSESGIR